jgi:hypothetical protein
MPDDGLAVDDTVTPRGKRDMLAKPDVKVSSSFGTDMKNFVVGLCFTFVR